jgi:hypothetical protein
MSEINLPDVLAEVSQSFHAYEAALMNNDVAALATFFWASPHVTRYGIADRQWGAEALQAFRVATPAPNFTRVLEHLRINSFGRDSAVAQVEFVRSDTALRGFQTQLWQRLDGKWTIVAAHVSMIDWP